MATVSNSYRRRADGPCSHSGDTCCEILFTVALGTVGFDVLFPLQAGEKILAPRLLGDIAKERIGPIVIGAMGVMLGETAALPVMADGAAEIIEFVTPLPATRILAIP